MYSLFRIIDIYFVTVSVFQTEKQICLLCSYTLAPPLQYNFFLAQHAMAVRVCTVICPKRCFAGVRYMRYGCYNTAVFFDTGVGRITSHVLPLACIDLNSVVVDWSLGPSS